MKVEGSGFFRSENIDGRWWLIDPDGHLFLHKGVCNVTTGITESRQQAFESRFGTPGRWAEETTRELRALGFNGTGAWTDVDLLKNVMDPLVYTRHINFIRPYAREREKYGYKIGREHLQPGDWEYLNEFIFAFDPEFEAFCDRRARALVDYKDEKSLLGYFSDNELGLQADQLDRCMDMDERDPARIAAEEWLLERKGATIPAEEITAEDRDAFLGYIAERYYSQVARAIKK